MPKTEYIVSSRLYNEGHGEAYITDKGCALLDRLEDLPGLTSSCDAFGNPLTVTVEGLGQILRPVPTPQDNDVLLWNKFGFGYYNWTPDIRQRVRWIAFTSNVAGLEPYATSTFSAPENPHFSFRVVLPPSNGDWDFSGKPPYFRLEFGAAGPNSYVWAIHIQNGAAFLVATINGTPVSFGQITLGGNQGGYGFVTELEFVVLCQDGKIAVSGDCGNRWLVVSDPTRRPIEVPSAPMTIRHRGNMVYFNLGNIVPAASAEVYSPPRNAGKSRVLPTVTITGQYATSLGSTVMFTDLSDPFNGSAKWKATLARGSSVGSFPFTWYTTPNLGTVTYTIPPLVTSLGNTYTTPWDATTYEVRVSKPLDLSTATATVRFKLPPGNAFFSQGYRFRRVDLYMGVRVRADNGTITSETWYEVFSGYITRIHVADTVLYTDVQVTLWNAATKFRTTEWTPFDIRALGGMSARNAANYVLGTEGWGPGNAIWDAQADRLLPAGTYKEPFLFLKRKEKKWKTLEDIFSYVDRQIGITDSGVLQDLPRDYYSGTYHPYYADESATDRSNLIESVEATLDYTQSVTSLIVSGKLPNGSEQLGYIVDTPAETDLTSGRFMNWRTVLQVEIPDVCDSYTVNQRVAYEAREAFPLKAESNPSLFVNLGIARGDGLIMHGMASRGYPDGSKLKVLTLEHTYRMNPYTAEFELKTTAGTRRIS